MFDEIVPVVAIAFVFGGPLVGILGVRLIRCIESVSRAAIDNRLKIRMIDRGYSVQEIERLCEIPLDHDAVRRSLACPVGPAKPIKA